MKFVIYDFEVSKHDWLVVFKDYDTKQYTIIHNDNEAFKQCISEDIAYVGFNNKGYDQFIAKAIWKGFDNKTVKAVNDIIIGGEIGWNIEGLQSRERMPMLQIDLMDDCQVGTSLKSIEGHLMMNIQETEVDFNLDRPWTRGELDLMIKYCCADVDATEKLFDLRNKYLETKANIGQMSGLTREYSMSLTNAKLTAKFLGAVKQEHNDEREYQYPDNLKREYIPKEVFDFFDRMHDKSISDEELFTGNLEIKIGDCPVTLGFGGIHGALPNYFWKEGDDS